jgi:hypothetical protein
MLGLQYWLGWEQEEKLWQGQELGPDLKIVWAGRWQGGWDTGMARGIVMMVLGGELITGKK